MFLEVVEHVFIDANGNCFFLRGNDEDSFRPVNVEWNCIRVIANGFFDFGISKRIDASPVSLAPSGIVPRDDRNILAVLYGTLSAPR